MPASITIAIDGPAGAGKGTLARRLADYYHLALLDTGLTYRAVAHMLLEKGWPLNDVAHAIEAARLVDLGGLDRKVLSAHDIGDAASKIAVMHPRCARFVVEASSVTLRHARRKVHVLDGRDIGTVVCPDAEVKLYVTASAEVRAQAPPSPRSSANGGVADFAGDPRRHCPSRRARHRPRRQLRSGRPTTRTCSIPRNGYRGRVFRSQVDHR
jgi:cytidylate kinase